MLHSLCSLLLETNPITGRWVVKQMNETGLSVAVAGRSETRLAEVESDQSKRLVVDVTNLQQLLEVRVYDREVSFDSSNDRALGVYSY